MKTIIEEFGTAIIAGFICILMITIGIGAYKLNATDSQEIVNPNRVEVETARTKEEIENQQSIVDSKKKPTIIAHSANLDKNSIFNYLEYVEAYSPSGNDISNQVKIVNITPSSGNKSSINGKYELDTSKVGVYTLKFMITYQSISNFAEATYIVD